MSIAAPQPSLDKLLDLDLSWADEILRGTYAPRRRRPPHPPLAMIRAMMYQSVKQIASWRKLALTIKSEPELAKKLGFQRPPCHDSFSEFTIRVGPDVFAKLFKELVDRLRSFIPELGKVSAIDSTIVRGYSHPRPKRAKKTDPDAAWGVSGQKLGKRIYSYGYKLQVICDAARDTPLSFGIAPANRHDSKLFPAHLKAHCTSGEKPEILTADAGYDSKKNTLLCIKYGIKPVIALNPRRSRVKGRRRSDYLLPITRVSPEWDHYYSMRSSVERVFSRLKEELGLLDLKLRTIPRVAVHFAIRLITMIVIALTSCTYGRPDLSLSVEPWRYSG